LTNEPLVYSADRVLPLRLPCVGIDTQCQAPGGRAVLTKAEGWHYQALVASARPVLGFLEAPALGGRTCRGPHPARMDDRPRPALPRVHE
jgi:hypothetical protein